MRLGCTQDILLKVVDAGVIGGCITVVGWIVTDLQYRRRWRRETDQRHRETERQATCRYIERQIEELYGPLLGLIRFSKEIYDVAATILPSKDDPEGGRQTDPDSYTPQDWEAWHFLTETYFHPTNAKVRDKALFSCLL